MTMAAIARALFGMPRFGFSTDVEISSRDGCSTFDSSATGTVAAVASVGVAVSASTRTVGWSAGFDAGGLATDELADGLVADVVVAAVALVADAAVAVLAGVDVDGAGFFGDPGRVGFGGFGFAGRAPAAGAGFFLLSPTPVPPSADPCSTADDGSPNGLERPESSSRGGQLLRYCWVRARRWR